MSEGRLTGRAWRPVLREEDVEGGKGVEGAGFKIGVAGAWPTLLASVFTDASSVRHERGGVEDGEGRKEFEGIKEFGELVAVAGELVAVAGELVAVAGELGSGLQISRLAGGVGCGSDVVGGPILELERPTPPPWG